MTRYQQRRDRLRKLVKKAGGDSILITNFVNVSYLTGFTGDDSYLLVSKDGAVMLSDSRYSEQLEGECPGLDLVIRRSPVTMLSSIEKTVKRAKLTRMAIEGDSMTVSLQQAIQGEISRLDLVTSSGLVEQLREVKDKVEVEAIRAAVHIAQRAFAVIKASLRLTETEIQVAHRLEHQIRLFGGQGCAFDPIVAVGSHAALPHAVPTGREIGSADFVLFDWGALAGHYMSDLTRVLVTGRISPKLERIYGVVLKAQRQAIKAIKPGATMHDVDAAARNVIAKAGYGKQFGHGLGHGFGLEIHEGVRLAANQHRPLKAGMIVTVEPGIYITGWGGVRIEDDVLVTRNGHEVLTNVPKELDDCVITVS